MTDIDSGIRFPGESEEYRRERNRLLEAEVGLRRAIEQVAAQRRALPRGGVVAEDYRFEEASDGREVRFRAATCSIALRNPTSASNRRLRSRRYSFDSPGKRMPGSICVICVPPCVLC